MDFAPYEELRLGGLMLKKPIAKRRKTTGQKPGTPPGFLFRNIP
jgi:hypothetical protein